MSRADVRQRNYLLHCRTCGAGFFEMEKLLRHRNRCQGDAQKQARSDERHAGQADLATEASAVPPPGRGAR
jgi:hypothetical protein